jgi:nascent polypeptide-associated complex subunit beta
MSDAVKKAREEMIKKRFGGNKAGAATGGSGSARQKAKGKGGGGADASRISSVFKKFQFNDMNGLMEVNIFKGDDVIHITEPKIKASIPCNTFQVTGKAETKPMTDLLPDILNQLGPESMERLRAYAASLQGASGAAAAAAPAGQEPIAEEGEDSDDDEIPDLVDENFDDAQD